MTKLISRRSYASDKTFKPEPDSWHQTSSVHSSPTPEDIEVEYLSSSEDTLDAANDFCLDEAISLPLDDLSVIDEYVQCARPTSPILPKAVKNDQEQERINNKRKCAKKCHGDEGTHSFDCPALNKQAFPENFRGLLGLLQVILAYLYVEDALPNLGVGMEIWRAFKQCNVRNNLTIALGLDWHSSDIFPFLRRLLRDNGLEGNVVCVEGHKIQDQSSRNVGEIDMFLCQQREGRQSPVPVCPIVLQNHPSDDPADRLKKWIAGHLEALEQHGMIHREQIWPVPYFVVHKARWSVGFAIKGNNGMKLHEELLGIMGWRNGVQKIIWVLVLVINNIYWRYSQFPSERLAQALANRGKHDANLAKCEECCPDKQLPHRGRN